MGRLSRTRLKIFAVLKETPAQDVAALKVRLRDNEPFKKEVATAFACRFLKGHHLVPTAAEIARATVTIEAYYSS